MQTHLKPSQNCRTTLQHAPLLPQARVRVCCCTHRRLAAAAANASAAAAASSSTSVDQPQPQPTKQQQPQDSNNNTTAPLDGWRLELLDAALGDDAAASRLAKLSLRGRVSGTMPYRQLTLRPVALRGGRRLQLSLLDAKTDVTKNFATRAEARAALEALLPLPWSGAALAASDGSGWAVQVTRGGRAIVQRTSGGSNSGGGDKSSSGSGSGSGEKEREAATAPAPALRHDRAKAQPLPADEPDPFLQRIGLQTADGRVRAAQAGKFAQVNKFIELLLHTGAVERLLKECSGGSGSSGGGGRPLRLLDAGCGAALLTLSTYRYLTRRRGARVALTGVDTNAALMARSAATAAELGIADDAEFVAAPIGGFRPRAPPDVVLALHACDTATDDALMLGVEQGAAVIMSVPCCHQTLQRQWARARRRRGGGKRGSSGGDPNFALPGLSTERGSSSGGGAFDDGDDSDSGDDEEDGSSGSGNGITGDPMLALDATLGALTRHGILRQRWLDLATDALRCALLRAAGYTVDAVEFVSGEHTPRNLLIRAVRPARPAGLASRRRAWREYVRLRDALLGVDGLRPRLEQLLLDAGKLAALGVE